VLYLADCRAFSTILPGQANAAYIAAVGPDVALATLAYVDALEAKVRELTEQQNPRWVPVAEWQKKHHVEVYVLWRLHKGWVSSSTPVYWDEIGGFWRWKHGGDRLQRHVEYVTQVPTLPTLPPALTDAPAKPQIPSKEALAALFWTRYKHKLTRQNEPLESDDIRDIMPFKEDGELHVQVHMRGFTDWYSLKFDAAGQPDSTSIEQLPF
jgi:hypothetical protein